MSAPTTDICPHCGADLTGEAREYDARKAIGLSAAEEGDVFGALKFVDFMHHELAGLTVGSELPSALRDRLRMAARDMELLATFIEGYAAAHSFTPPTDPEEGG